MNLQCGVCRVWYKVTYRGMEKQWIEGAGEIFPERYRRQPRAQAAKVIVSAARNFRRFVVAEMAFASRFAPRPLAQDIDLAFGSRHRYQFLQHGAAAMRTGRDRSRSDQEFERFVAMITTIIVDRHIFSCRVAYKMTTCVRY